MPEHSPANKDPRMTPKRATAPLLDRLIGKLLDLGAWWIRRGGLRGKR